MVSSPRDPRSRPKDRHRERSTSLPPAGSVMVRRARIIPSLRWDRYAGVVRSQRMIRAAWFGPTSSRGCGLPRGCCIVLRILWHGRSGHAYQGRPAPDLGSWPRPRRSWYACARRACHRMQQPPSSPQSFQICRMKFLLSWAVHNGVVSARRAYSYPSDSLRSSAPLKRGAHKNARPSDPASPP
jgi:hypothetical protein